MPLSPLYSGVTPGLEITKQSPLALPNPRFDFFNIFGGGLEMGGVGVGLDDLKGSFPF